MTQTTVTRQQLVEVLTDYCYFDDGDKLTAHQNGTFTLKFKDGLRNRVRQPKIETVLSYNIDGFNYVRLDYGVNKSPNGGFVHTIKFMFTPVVTVPVTEPEVIDAPAPVLTDAQVSDAGQDDKFRHVNEVVNNAMLNLMEADAQQPHRVAFHKIYSHIVDIENDYHLGNESKPDTIYEVTDFARRCIRLLEVLESQDIPEVNGFLRAFGKQQA